MEKAINAITVIIVLNVIVFGIPFIMPDLREQMNELLPLYFPKNEHFKYWQFVSSMFMHGSVSHLLFNMYALWAFGTPLEQMWGKKKFVTFYFLAGIGAGLIYSLVNYLQFESLYNEFIGAGLSAEEIQKMLTTGNYSLENNSSFPAEKLQNFYDLFHIPAVGASGAIYGVLVAFGISFPNSKLALIFLPVPIAAKYFIPILIAIDLFSGVTGFSLFGGGIAHFAHVGGAIIGFLLMLYYRKQTRRLHEE
jgi:membrane associated rhomboid family serine protease